MISDELKEELQTLSIIDKHALIYLLMYELKMIGLIFGEDEARDEWTQLFGAGWNDTIWNTIYMSEDWDDIIDDSIRDDAYAHLTNVICKIGESMGMNAY